MERIERLEMGLAHLLEHLRKVLHQLNAVSHLNRRRCPWACAICLGCGAVSRDDLHARVGAAPRCAGVGVSIPAACERPPPLQVDQDRARRVTCPERPGIDAKDRGRRKARQRLTAHHAQAGVPTHPQAPALAQTYTGRAPKGQAERDEALSQAQRAPSPGRHKLGQARGEAAARAAPVGAAKLPDPELSHDADVCPWQIRQSALIITLDAARGQPAHGTMHQRLSRGDAPGQLGCPLVHMRRLQVSRGPLREHARPEVHRPPRRKKTSAVRRFLSETYTSGKDIVGD